MNNTRKLVLHITFKVKKENKALLNLMESLKALRELIFWVTILISRFAFSFLDQFLF
jgi:hypothetical protein